MLLVDVEFERGRAKGRKQGKAPKYVAFVEDVLSDYPFECERKRYISGCELTMANDNDPNIDVGGGNTYLFH